MEHLCKTIKSSKCALFSKEKNIFIGNNSQIDVFYEQKKGETIFYLFFQNRQTHIDVVKL
jgi:uncharacterized ParB-like nuclease family protein